MIEKEGGQSLAMCREWVGVRRKHCGVENDSSVVGLTCITIAVT